MNKKIKIGIMTLAFIYSFTAYAENKDQALMQKSDQILLVTANNQDTTKGELLLLQRVNQQSPWQIQGPAIQVVLGKKGMAYGNNAGLSHFSVKKAKIEGDLKTPTGIFTIATSFGFAASALKADKLPYMPIQADTVCVDDSASIYYNQIIHSSKVPNNSWHSGENMQQIKGYVYGLVINYNTSKPLAKRGSCIFMHVWKNANEGTAGCIAMTQNHVENILSWLEPKKNPLVIILPKADYGALEKNYHLPPLPDTI